MSSSKSNSDNCFEANSMLLVLLPLLVASLSQRAVEASGVFELEFLRLEQLGDTRQSATATTTNESLDNNRTIEQLVTAQQQQHQDPANLVRVLVCLKEAFTSQLDGPCTFGNASITLHRDSIQLSEPPPPPPVASPIVGSSKQHQEQEQQDAQATALQRQQQGSRLTNIVRILFTFRWTKSFTIILTAEQLQADSAANATNQHHQSRRLVAAIQQQQQLPVHRNGASHNNNGTSPPVDPPSTGSSNNRPTLHIVSSGGSSSSGGRMQFIDRHVLTENEVLPNLEPNPNKPWASRFSRSLKSSLAYRFRVYCSLNYYGDGCTTFCRARDDQFGHYNCSSTGQKVCLDGWSGTDCDKAKCRPGCNQQNGYCDKPDTCQCRPGWTGPRCDECITYPGCQNGYCLSSWQCFCKPGWGGIHCDQDLNYCGTHEPCSNNGTCQNIAPGKYKCNCPDGFTGLNCDINLSLLPGGTGSMAQLSAGCALNPCLNGGTCFGFNSVLVADSAGPVRPETTDVFAHMGFNGEASSQQQELLASGDRYYRCQCAPGWSGDYCQWPESLTVTNFSPDASSLGQAERTSQHQPTGLPATMNVTEVTMIPSPAASDDAMPLNGAETEVLKHELSDKIPPLLSVFTGENSTPALGNHASVVDLRHLISGVVIASIVGVFLASLLLAWCCLIAIEHNKFSFIQMNIIRSGTDGGESGGIGQPAVVSSTLRRMQEKIRDSLRRSSSTSIKPETKLSIENVLRPPKPPPTYEESNSYRSYMAAHTLDIHSSSSIRGGQEKGVCATNLVVAGDHETPTKTHKCDSTTMKDNLVISGALEQKLGFAYSTLSGGTGSSAVPTTSSPAAAAPVAANQISLAKLNCPRHGHLYRHQHQHHHNDQLLYQRQLPPEEEESQDHSLYFTQIDNN